MARKSKRIHHHPIVSEFAKRLRATRRRLGITQYELAHRAKVSISYTGKVERAELAPGLDMVACLAAAMDVPVASLIGESTPDERGHDAVARALRDAVERLLKKDNFEAVKALAVIAAGLSKGASRR